MQEIAAAFKDWYAVLAAMVLAVFWFARLEGRSTRNTDDLKNLEKRLAQQRTEDMATRQRDWDQMMSRMDGIQSDIKELLQRTSKS